MVYRKERKQDSIMSNMLFCGNVANTEMESILESCFMSVNLEMEIIHWGHARALSIVENNTIPCGATQLLFQALQLDSCFPNKYFVNASNSIPNAHEFSSIN